IVRVKAVVMTRDESSGGWLAQEGGGLSRVGVCKVVPADLELLGRNGFLIFGERVKDKECFLKKDLVYTKATPTFHHWRVDNRKCGLSFQSPADARAFDQSLSPSRLKSQREEKRLPSPRSQSLSTCLTRCVSREHRMCYTHTPAAEGELQLASGSYLEELMDIFDVDLIDWFGEVIPNSSESPLVLPSSCSPEFPPSLSLPPPLLKPASSSVLPPLVPVSPSAHPQSALSGRSDSPRGFQSPAPPSGDGHTPRNGKTGIGGGVVTGQPRALTAKWLPRRVEDSRERLRCVYCQNMFSPAENGRGRCQEAPDPVQTCIRRVSFMWCADSLLYHCMSDPEGDYSDPCSCDASEERFCLRWLALLGLSLLAPCMCCYAPLRACYHCGVACHCCGGKHKAAG
uniref:Sprouty-related, EVH1 domain-containing protein 2 n=1 Tax=Sinocyclocheilus rhinocerous TaxID=307959 RepID=A0A673G649_9TELE